MPIRTCDPANHGDAVRWLLTNKVTGTAIGVVTLTAVLIVEHVDAMWALRGKARGG